MPPAAGSASGAEGKLSSTEAALYKKIKGSVNQRLSEEDVRAAFPSIKVEDVAQAINGLAGRRLLVFKKDAAGKVIYQAVSVEEARQSAAMSTEESMVYSVIRDGGDEGVWTKRLRAITGIQPTILNKVLKVLEGKNIIKQVKNVKTPTRKIYMLAHLKPSVAITGGPWYTDQDLDEEFITQLLHFCYEFVRRKSFPRTRPRRDIPEELFITKPIYPPSHTAKLPSPSDVQSHIKESNTFNVELSVKEVMQLMNVLSFDGRVEILRPVRKHHEEGWNSDLEETGGGMDSDEEKAERKERDRARQEAIKRKRGAGTTFTNGNGHHAFDEDIKPEIDKSDSEEDARAKKKRKKEKEREEDKRSKEKEREKEKRRRKKEKEKREKEKEKRRRAKEKERRRKAKQKERERRSRSRSKSRSRKGSDSDTDSDDSDMLVSIDDKKRKKKSKSKSRSHSSDESSSSSDLSSSDDSSLSSSDDSDSDSDSDSSSAGEGRSRASSVSSNEIDSEKFQLGTKKSASLGELTMATESAYFDALEADTEYDIHEDENVVYRVVRDTALQMGGTDAPCGRCPQFDFCSTKGPVNPSGCEYFDEWLLQDYRA